MIVFCGGIIYIFGICILLLNVGYHFVLSEQQQTHCHVSQNIAGLYQFKSTEIHILLEYLKCYQSIYD